MKASEARKIADKVDLNVLCERYIEDREVYNTIEYVANNGRYNADIPCPYEQKIKSGVIKILKKNGYKIKETEGKLIISW